MLKSDQVELFISVNQEKTVFYNLGKMTTVTILIFVRKVTEKTQKNPP